MINISLKLRSGELKELYRINDLLYRECAAQLDTIDFYNMRYLQKKLLDKCFIDTINPKKKCSVSFNANVCTTLNKLYLINADYINGSAYHYFLINYVIHEMKVELQKKKSRIYYNVIISHSGNLP
jgi:hypothetical protein